MHGSLLFALTLVSCSAQDAPPRRPSAAPSSDAAPQVAEYVVASLEDSRGDLWFGTNGQGVARYSPASAPGTSGELRYFSIAEGLVGDVVTGIAEDRDGRLWFGTHTGASCYEPNAEKRNGPSAFTSFGEASGLRGSGCKLLVTREGALWAGTSDGVFRLDGERFNAFALPVPALPRPSYKIVPGKVWDLLEDKQGNLWFARDGYGLCRYDPSATDGAEVFTTFTKADGLCSDNAAGLALDAAGRLWVGCITSDHPQWINEGGLSRFDPAHHVAGTRPVFTRFDGLKGLTANDIYNLYVDRSGRTWIGAVRVGAYRFDPSREASGEPFTLFDVTDRPDLTQSFGIQAMLEDRHGTLWFGFSGGLFRFDGAKFVNVTRAGPWASP